jgi:PncC family amidohydrolase
MIMDGDALSKSTANDRAAAAGRALQARGWRLVVAESCTGGRLGDTVTNVGGSSAWFVGGIIAYADAIKIGLLGVPADLIREHGAVSAPVAAAMAQGARARTGAEVALAVTGITGPGGGSPAKPVGTVYIGLATPTGVQTVHHRWSGDRDGNKQASVVAALDVLMTYLAHDERDA